MGLITYGNDIDGKKVAKAIRDEIKMEVRSITTLLALACQRMVFTDCFLGAG